MKAKKNRDQRKLEVAPPPALQKLLTKIKSTATERNHEVNKKLFAELALLSYVPFKRQILQLIKETDGAKEFQAEFRRRFRVEFLSKGSSPSANVATERKREKTS